ncbi:replication initiation protein, partial [Kineococcus rhizosphaerae]
VDVDHRDTLLRAISRPLAHPEPSWVAESPSGRGHVGWVLRTPVCRTDSGRPKPLAYAAKVEEGLRAALDGDVGYAGLLTKNPIHPDWATTWGAPEPYSLEELARGLGDLMPRVLPRRAVESSGLGRNVTLFNVLRRWAYRSRYRYDVQGEWEEVTLAYAVNVNAEFPVPLGVPEVASTARSVARWVWRHEEFGPEGFRAVQARRGRIVTPAVREANRVRRTKVNHADVVLEVAE